jgi:hypothetical protein
MRRKRNKIGGNSEQEQVMPDIEFQNVQETGKVTSDRFDKPILGPGSKAECP